MYVPGQVRVETSSTSLQDHAAARARAGELYPPVARCRARHAFVAALIGSILLGVLQSRSQVSAAEAERFSIVIRARSVDVPQRTIRASQGVMLELAFAADETV